MRLGRGITLAVAMALAGCGAAATPAAAPTSSLIPTTSASATSPPTPATNYRVGDKVVTAHHNTVQLVQFVRPAPITNEFLTPDPGSNFAAALVEACEGQTDLPSVEVNPFDFVLVLDDHSRVQTSVADAETPPLHDTTLSGPGDCVRGWVTYTVPTAQKVVEVVDTIAVPQLRWEVNA